MMNPESPNPNSGSTQNKLASNSPAEIVRPISTGRRAGVSAWAQRLAFMFVLIITIRHAARRLPPIWTIPTEAMILSFTPDDAHLWTSELLPDSNRWSFTKRRANDGTIAAQQIVDFGDEQVERVEINVNADTIACRFKAPAPGKPACLINTTTGEKTYSSSPVSLWVTVFSPTFRLLVCKQTLLRLSHASITVEESGTGTNVATFGIESFDGLHMDPTHVLFNDSEKLLATIYNSSSPDSLNCAGAVIIYDVAKRQPIVRHRCSKPGYWIAAKWIGNRLLLGRYIMDNNAQRRTIEYYSYAVNPQSQLDDEKLIYSGLELMEPSGKRVIETHQQLFLHGPWALRWDQTSVQRQLTDTGHWVDRLLQSLGPAVIDRTRIVNLETDQQLIRFDQMLVDGHFISHDGKYLAGRKTILNHPPPFDQWFPHVPAIVCYQVDPLAQRQNLWFRIACGSMAFLTATTWLRWELNRRRASRT